MAIVDFMKDLGHPSFDEEFDFPLPLICCKFDERIGAPFEPLFHQI